MDKLAHGGAGDGFAVLAVGFHALAEGPDEGIVLPGSERGRHVQGLAQGGVTGFGEAGFPDPLAGFLESGREAGIGSGLLGMR